MTLMTSVRSRRPHSSVCKMWRGLAWSNLRTKPFAAWDAVSAFIYLPTVPCSLLLQSVLSKAEASLNASQWATPPRVGDQGESRMRWKAHVRFGGGVYLSFFFNQYLLIERSLTIYWIPTLLTAEPAIWRNIGSIK